MRRTRKQFAAELERDQIACITCKGTGFTDHGLCYSCDGDGHLTAAEWAAECERMREVFADSAGLAERIIRRHEGGRTPSKRNPIGDELRSWMREHLLEDLDRAYAYYYEMIEAAGYYSQHIHHPSTTVATLRGWLDAYTAQPDQWFLASSQQHTSWCRSLLESMARAG